MASLLHVYILYCLHFIGCFLSIKIYDSRGPDDWLFSGCYTKSITSLQCDLTQSVPLPCAALCGWDSYIRIPSNGYISTKGYADITVTYTLKASNMNGISNGDDPDRCEMNYIYPLLAEWQYLDDVQYNFYRFNITKALPEAVYNKSISFNVISF